MPYALLIHSLFTALSIAAFALCVLQTRSARDFLRGARAHLDTVEAIEDRFDALERGQDRFADSLARCNGRIGALVAHSKARDRTSPHAGDYVADAEELASNGENPERERLQKLLAERHRG